MPRIPKAGLSAETRTPLEKKGGYPAGDKSASQLRPPPPALTSKQTDK